MSLRTQLIGQFKKPHGALGRVAGKIMTWRRSNRQRNRWTVVLLGIEPGDEVLEIGYGPGLAAGWAAQKVRSGHITGIDHSATMHAQASKRNRRWIKHNRLTLLCGDVFDLPHDTGHFDKVYSANVAQFWEEPVRVFSLLHDHMKPGGTIATTFMPRGKDPSKEDADAFARNMGEAMSQAGFHNLYYEWLDLEPVPAVCILAKS